MKFSGTFCASLTPLNRDFSINHDTYYEHCNRLVEEGADGIAIFGTTGEANLLSLEVSANSFQKSLFLFDENFSITIFTKLKLLQICCLFLFNTVYQS